MDFRNKEKRRRTSSHFSLDIFLKKKKKKKKREQGNIGRDSMLKHPSDSHGRRTTLMNRHSPVIGLCLGCWPQPVAWVDTMTPRHVDDRDRFPSKSMSSFDTDRLPSKSKTSPCSLYHLVYPRTFAHLPLRPDESRAS